MTRVLGVTPRTPGYAEIDVAPHLCGLAHARGSVCTPRGKVKVAWRAADGRFKIEIDAPAAIPVYVRMPNNERRQFSGGQFSAELSLIG